jgi:DNA-binding NtrC family response regulator
MQVRLKRFLQTGEFYRENSTQIRRADVRMIVASTVDLTSPEYKDRFSRDVLYHLMINSIYMPPLRDRIGDLPLLVEKLLDQEADKAGRKFTGVADEVLDYLKDYSFPSNVMELRTMIAGAVANEDADTLTVESLPPSIRQMVEGEKAGVTEAFVPKRLDVVVKDYVLKTLEHFSNQKDLAARELGITVEELDRIAGA